MSRNDRKAAAPQEREWDHSSDTRFTEHFAKESESRDGIQRAQRLREAILRVLTRCGRAVAADSLDVLDVGCNAGTLCTTWAADGHRTHGLDVNAPLLDLARWRAAEQDLDIDFRLGSAVALPWQEATMDVCVANELLEHVEDWERCVDEMARVLRPGGVLCITTTNVYCPRQNEFNLPLYAWYPKFVKKRCIELAITTRPGLANYARYPARHWFSYFGLRRHLEPMGFDCYDRFDVADTGTAGPARRAALQLIRRSPSLRRLAYLGVTGTILFAVKRSRPTQHDRTSSRPGR